MAQFRSLVAEAAQKEDSSRAASVTVVYMLGIFENNGKIWQVGRITASSNDFILCMALKFG